MNNLFKIFFLSVMFAFVCMPNRAKGKERNWTDSILTYKNVLDAFPCNAPLTDEYLENAVNLCLACTQGQQQYELGEKVAAKALFRALAIADSNYYCGILFSFMALFYEHKGDTIMPPHFHRKAQKIGLKNTIRNDYKDSVKIYDDRINSLIQQMDYLRQLSSKHAPAYFECLSEYFTMVCRSGNIYEIIYLGENILKSVSKLEITVEGDFCGKVYANLPYCYAAKGEIEKAEQMLSFALNYYEKHPKNAVNEAWMLYSVASGLAAREDYDEALQFLHRAKKKVTKKDDEWKPELTELLRICRKELRK